MVGALKALGINLEEDWEHDKITVHGCAGKFPVENAKLYLGNAGTAMRYIPHQSNMCASANGHACHFSSTHNHAMLDSGSPSAFSVGYLLLHCMLPAWLSGSELQCIKNGASMQQALICLASVWDACLASIWDAYHHNVHISCTLHHAHVFQTNMTVPHLASKHSTVLWG